MYGWARHLRSWCPGERKKTKRRQSGGAEVRHASTLDLAGGEKEDEEEGAAEVPRRGTLFFFGLTG